MSQLEQQLPILHNLCCLEQIGCPSTESFGGELLVCVGGGQRESQRFVV